MPLRSRAARIAILVLAAGLALPGRAAEFTDAAGRRVSVPGTVARVMPGDQAAAVLIFVLAPAKLIGWSEPLSRAQRAYLPAKFAGLPVLGNLAGANPGPAAEAVRRWHPDLILTSGSTGPEAAAGADHLAAATRTPVVIAAGSIQRTPEMLRSVGILLGAGDHRLDAASYAFHAIQGLRGKLLIQSANLRPVVYYGLGDDGLTTGREGSLATAVIAEAGAVNAAARLGRGESSRVSRQQIVAWNPDIVIAQQRGFYDALRRDPAWRGLTAVRDKRVYLAPSLPFGWIGDPAGVNRMVGLYWLSDLLYPNALEEDLRTNVREFYQIYYGVALTDRQLEALLRPAAPAALLAQGTVTVPLFGAEPTPEPELSPRALPGPRALPLSPPGRGGLPPNSPGGSGGPQ
jgi:iron complex transport system substrate-binding protein